MNIEISEKEQQITIITRGFLQIAEKSWNPDNFSELLELMRLQYPDIDLSRYEN